MLSHFRACLRRAKDVTKTKTPLTSMAILYAESLFKIETTDHRIIFTATAPFIPIKKYKNLFIFYPWRQEMN
jgi:hypothetical protein